MAISPGETLLGRYEVLAPLPPVGEVERWRGKDTTSGEAVEIRSPERTALLRPEARERMRQAAVPGRAPARLNPLASGEHKGRPFLVFPGPLLPFQPPSPLSPELVEAAAAWLGPALLEAEPALAGELEMVDLALDTQGRPWLLPSGLVRPRSLARPSFHRGPERAGEAPPPPGAAAYGLGTLLFELATGLPPFQARTQEQLRRLQASPPAAQQLQPGISERLSILLGELLSPAPGRRLVALAQLETPPAPPLLPVPEAPIPTSAPAAAPPVQLSSSPTSLDIALPSALLVLEEAAPSRAALRRLAALADVDEEVIDALSSQGLPVPLAGGSQAAGLDPARLSGEGGGARIARRSTGWPLLRVTLALGSLALAGLALLVALGLGGAASMTTGGIGLPALLLLLTAAMLPALLSLGLGVGIASERAEVRRLRAAWARIVAGAPPGPLRDARRQIRAARRQILEADLAVPIRQDLLEVAEELDRELDALPATGEPGAFRAIGEAAEALRQAPGSVEDPARSADRLRDLAARRAAIRASGRT